MDRNWFVKKLGEVCISDLGKTLNQSKDKGEMYPYLCAINVLWDKIDLSTLKQTKFKEEEIERYSVRKGDLLICEGGDIGRAAIWDKDETILYQNALHRVRFNDEVLPRYCLLYLRHLKENGVLDSRYGKGVTIKHLVKSSLLSIPIPIPSLSEQSRILEELDQLSNIIEKKRQQLSELDNLAQSIFYDMFGDVNSFVPLSEYVDGLLAGKSLAGDEECVNKVLKTGAVTYDYFDEKQVKSLPLNYEPNIEHKVNRNDLLVSRMNTAELVGACAYVWEIDGSVYLPDRLWKADVKENANPIYIWKALIQPKSKEQIRQYASGTSGSMKNISKNSFLKIQIPFVSLSLQQLFAQKIEAIEKEKELIKQSIKETEELFNSRMDYYFG